MSVLFLSHPAIRHAQAIANRKERTMLLVRNFIGGIDIVDATHRLYTKEGDDSETIAIIHPQPLGAAS